MPFEVDPHLTPSERLGCALMGLAFALFIVGLVAVAQVELRAAERDWAARKERISHVQR